MQEDVTDALRGRMPFEWRNLLGWARCRGPKRSAGLEDPMSENFSFKFSLLVCLCMTAFCSSCSTANRQLSAYAHVLGDGTLDAANPSNVAAFGNDGNGFYCFKLNFRPKNVVATLADDPTAPNQGVGFIKVELPPIFSASCVMQNPDSQVETGDQTSINGGKSAGGYAFYVYWTR